MFIEETVHHNWRNPDCLSTGKVLTNHLVNSLLQNFIRMLDGSRRGSRVVFMDPAAAALPMNQVLDVNGVSHLLLHKRRKKGRDKVIGGGVMMINPMRGQTGHPRRADWNHFFRIVCALTCVERKANLDQASAPSKKPHHVLQGDEELVGFICWFERGSRHGLRWHVRLEEGSS